MQGNVVGAGDTMMQIRCDPSPHTSDMLASADLFAFDVYLLDLP